MTKPEPLSIKVKNELAAFALHIFEVPFLDSDVVTFDRVIVWMSHKSGVLQHHGESSLASGTHTLPSGISISVMCSAIGHYELWMLYRYVGTYKEIRQALNCNAACAGIAYRMSTSKVTLVPLESV